MGRQHSTLSRAERILIREGLMVEYAPGHAAPIDLAATPAQRAALIAPLLVREALPIALTAAWIHTAWRPASRRIVLQASHPTRKGYNIVARLVIPDDELMLLAGHEVPTALRTAEDLLLLEPVDIAVEGVLQLIDAGLDVRELRRGLALTVRRRGIPRARLIARRLEEYLKERPSKRGRR